MKTNLKAVAVTTVVMALVLMARSAVAFPWERDLWHVYLWRLDGDLVQDALDAFPWMGAVTVMQIWTVFQTNGKTSTV